MSSSEKFNFEKLRNSRGEFLVHSSWKEHKIMTSLEKFNFERLRVYQDALDFSKQIYKTSKRFPIPPLAGQIYGS